MLYETAVTDENKNSETWGESIPSNDDFLKNNLCDGGIGLVAK